MAAEKSVTFSPRFVTRLYLISTKDVCLRPPGGGGLQDRSNDQGAVTGEAKFISFILFSRLDSPSGPWPPLRGFSITTTPISVGLL